MNAVQVLHRIENYFDRNHNLFIKFGGLFALIFFTLYVPYNMVNTMQDKLEAQQSVNLTLASELQEMSTRMEFLELSYEKKQAVLREVECLARNIYFEAGSESTDGKIAVAEVTMNRVKEGYARTVCAVVKQKRNGICQFSWVCQDKNTIRSREEYTESLKIAENILISQKKYSTMNGATYFHADYVKPAWASTKDFVRKIGRHLFYREETYANNFGKSD